MMLRNMPTIIPECRYCKKRESVRKHGKSCAGLRRYRCIQCDKTFQSNYIYSAYRSDV